MKAFYEAAKKAVTEYNNAAEKWMKEHNTRCIPVDIAATLPYAGIVTNELRSAIEVHEFLYSIPEKYFLYIDEKENKAITWTGDLLGKVYLGHKYRSSFGDTRQSIEVQAINGRTYYGTYYTSAGNYARIRLKKSA